MRSIVFLSGNSKEKFVEVANTNGFGNWNIQEQKDNHPKFLVWRKYKDEDAGIEDFIPWLIRDFNEEEPMPLKVLFIHGCEYDKNDICDHFGAFFINIGDKSGNSTTSNSDFMLFSDDVEFEKKVVNILECLTR